MGCCCLFTCKLNWCQCCNNFCWCSVDNTFVSTQIKCPWCSQLVSSAEPTVLMVRGGGGMTVGCQFHFLHTLCSFQDWLLALEWICQYTTLALFTTIAGMRVLTADYSKWDHMTCHLCQCHFSAILPGFRLCPPRAFFYPSNTVHDHYMPPSNPLSNAEPINLLQPLLWLKSFIACHTAHLRRHNCIAFSRLKHSL